MTKIRKTGIVILLLILAMLASCARGSDSAANGIPDGDKVRSGAELLPLRWGEGEDAAAAGAGANVYTFSGVEEMRAFVPRSENVIIQLTGYYTPGDGGGGYFYWDATSSEADNGGTVLAPAGTNVGRYFRLCEENVRNVRWFGAVGSGKKDDTNAIQNAIDSLPGSGGTVRFPGGTYAITRTIEIGDGDGGEKFSGRNGIRLVGSGAGFSALDSDVPTTLLAARSLGVMVRVNGRISDFALRNLAINCNGNAETGLYMTAVSGTNIGNVIIRQFRKTGMEVWGGDEPVGNYNTYNRFETVEIKASMGDTTCLLMDGKGHNDTWLTTFTDCSFDTGTCPGATGAHFRFVDSNSFYRCVFGGSGEGSTGIFFDATSKKDFPCGMGFYDCSVSSTKVLEEGSNTMRTNYFYGFVTANDEPIPDHNKLIGITDRGVPFNMDSLVVSGGGSGTGSSSSVPVKRGSFDLYTPADYSHKNLSFDNSEVGIHFAAGGHVAGGTFYLPSYSDSLGTINLRVYQWNTDYKTTVKGEVLFETSFVDFTDNTWNSFTVPDDKLPSGEYLLVLSSVFDLTHDPHGAGVWTKGKNGSVETFYNGFLSEFGVVGTLNVE